MDSKDFTRLEDAYKFIYSESKKDESPEKEEEDRKKDDDLFGSPNKNGNGKNGKNGDTFSDPKPGLADLTGPGNVRWRALVCNKT